MKKNLHLLLMLICCFILLGQAQAQCPLDCKGDDGNNTFECGSACKIFCFEISGNVPESFEFDGRDANQVTPTNPTDGEVCYLVDFGSNSASNCGNTRDAVYGAFASALSSETSNFCEGECMVFSADDCGCVEVADCDDGDDCDKTAADCTDCETFDADECACIEIPDCDDDDDGDDCDKTAADCTDCETFDADECDCVPVTEYQCEDSEENCLGQVTPGGMSVCGVCPPINAPACPPKCNTTCPPFTYLNPLTCACIATRGDECIPYSCDDGDPCTSGDFETRNYLGNVCEPCAGQLIEIESIVVINMRDCNDNGTADPSDDTFTGDIKVTFNYAPVIEDFIITGDAYFSYKEDYCDVNGNMITIPSRTFAADGEWITLHGIFNDRVSCSYTKNGLAGTALAPCSEGDESNGGNGGESDACTKTAEEGADKSSCIYAVTIDHIYDCYDNGSVYKTSDDYLTAKVTVHFGTDLPAKGVLELSGMVNTYVNLGRVSGSSYTFPRRLKLQYKNSNSIKVVVADYHSSHARICPINTYCFYEDAEVFSCEDPCSSSLTTNGNDSQSALVFTDFNAFQQDRHVDLEWLTNQSANSESYIIEKSLDGINFELMTTLSNSQFTDEVSYFKTLDDTPELGDNFYRLQQVFTDGSSEYSDVKVVNFGVDLDAISFFPNPAENELFIDLDEYQGKTGHMMITNQWGQLIEEVTFDEIPSELIRVDFSEYINGLYFIRTKVDRSKYVAKKVFVSKLY